MHSSNALTASQQRLTNAYDSSSGSGSAPPPPPPTGGRGQGFDDGSIFNTNDDSVSLSGDGSTPQTAIWSIVLKSNPTEQNTYVVYHLGIQRWVRTVFNEAQIYAGYGYNVLDVRSYTAIGDNDWVCPIPDAHQPTGQPFRRQEEEMYDAEDTLAGSSKSTPSERCTPAKKGTPSESSTPGKSPFGSGGVSV